MLSPLSPDQSNYYWSDFKMKLVGNIFCLASIGLLLVPYNVECQAPRVPQFLSYDSDFMEECSEDMRQTLQASSGPVTFDPAEPTPVTYANGQVHFNIKYKAKFTVLGVQVVSTDGWPLGKFPPTKDTLYCTPDSTQPTSDGTLFDCPKVTLTGVSPQVVKHKFPAPQGLFHLLWVYSIAEVAQVEKGFQVNVFFIPRSANCFISQFSPVYSLNHITLREWQLKSNPGSQYECHGAKVPVLTLNPPPPPAFDPNYMQAIENLDEIGKLLVGRGDLCPKDGWIFDVDLNGPLPEQTPKLGDFLKFEVYRLDPDMPGWYHFFISTDETQPLNFKKVVVRVVTRSGTIIGSYLRPDEVPCTDLTSKNDRRSYDFNQPPSGRTVDTPSVVEITFEDFVSEFSIFWNYRVAESTDAESGIQIQAYVVSLSSDGVTTIKDTTDHFSRQMSATYKLNKLTKDLKRGDGGPTQICKDPAKLLPPESATSGSRWYKLNYRYKQKCEAFGVQQGEEATSIWMMNPSTTTTEPPSTTPTTVASTSTTPSSASNQTTPAQNTSTTSAYDLVPLLPRGNDGPSEEDYIDTDYVDYTNVRAHLNETLNQADLIDINKHQFYDGCNELKTCIGWKDQSCIESKTCVAAVSFRKMKDRCKFELMGRTGKYLALGLSRDRLMGADSVIECVREDHSNLRIYMSYNGRNRDMPSRVNNRIKIQNDSIALLSGWLLEEENLLFCAFHRKRILTVRNDTFDLAKEKFYLLMAHGDTALQKILGGIGPHNRGSYASEEKYALMDSLATTRNLRWAEVAHAVCMTIAWVFCYPISLFMVRYFKETYFGKYILGMSIWFASHVILMAVTIFLTIASVSHVAYELGAINPFQQSYHARGWFFHNVATIVLLGLLLFQIGLGVFITPVRKESTRRLHLLHMLHGLLGHAMFFLSFAIIFKSLDMMAGLPCAAYGVLVAWIVLYFVVHLMMSYQVCYIDYVHGLHVSRVYAFPVLGVAETRVSEGEAPGGLARRILLGTFIFISLAVTGTIIVQIAMQLPNCVENSHAHKFTYEELD